MERFTVPQASNMDETGKLAPLVIGQFRNPRYFKSIINLPAHCENNSNAYVDGF